MFFISHRGNIGGINQSEENKPSKIEYIINLGLHVEIDVWYTKNAFYLGHDEPQYEVNKKFLKNEKLWCHAKNIPALEQLKKIGSTYFWHQEDDVTITSNGFFWTYPGKKLTQNSICVLPEKSGYKEIDLKLCAGICSDFINKFKK